MPLTRFGPLISRRGMMRILMLLRALWGAKRFSVRESDLDAEIAAWTLEEVSSFHHRMNWSATGKNELWHRKQRLRRFRNLRPEGGGAVFHEQLDAGWLQNLTLHFAQHGIHLD